METENNTSGGNGSISRLSTTTIFMLLTIMAVVTLAGIGEVSITFSDLNLVHSQIAVYDASGSLVGIYNSTSESFVPLPGMSYNLVIQPATVNYFNSLDGVLLFMDRYSKIIFAILLFLLIGFGLVILVLRALK